jgi:hypothetical protein
MAASAAERPTSRPNDQLPLAARCGHLMKRREAAAIRAQGDSASRPTGGGVALRRAPTDSVRLGRLGRESVAVLLSRSRAKRSFALTRLRQRAVYGVWTL